MPYDRKRLGFPFNYRTVLEQDSTRDFTPGNPETTEDCNFYVLNVTNDERTKLWSGLLAGLDLLYPDEFLDLSQLWLQMTEYPNTFPPATGACSVDLCQLIIDCINDPGSELSSVITNLIQNNTLESSRDYGQSQNNSDMSSDVNPTCDLDILFGQAMQLVDYLDQQNTDFFEILEASTNFYDFLADVIGDVTVIDETSIDAGLAWIQFIQDSIAENYAAQVTTAYKEQLACDIFCVARNYDCAITPALLYDIMADRLESTITVEGVIWDVLAFLVDGTWTGSQIADFMFYSQFALRSMLGRYFERLAWNDIRTRLAIYGNDPNSDWTVLCECSGKICFDMTDVSGLYLQAGVQDTTFGHPDDSIKSTNSSVTVFPVNAGSNLAFKTTIQAMYEFDQDVTIENVSFEIYSNTRINGSNTGQTGRFIVLTDSDDNVLDSWSGGSSVYQSWQAINESFNQSGVRKVWFGTAVTTGLPDSSGNVWLDNCCIDYVID